MLTGLSAEIVGLIERNPYGMKIAELQERLRKPPQEIEHAVSQLKRQGLIEQRQPGVWTRTNSAHGRTEREPQHTRIVYRPAPPPVFEPAVITLANHPVEAIAAIHITQETTMAKGKKTCTKCKTAKGPTAYSDSSEICRLCQKGKAPKAAAGSRKTKLREIVRKVAARKGGALSTALYELRARREAMALDLAGIDTAIAVLEKVA